MWRSRAIGLIIILFFLSLPGKSVLAKNLLIVEVQIAGEKSSNDFIKIYNPSNSDIYLDNYQGSYLRLVRRTKTGTKDYTIKSWSRYHEAKIPAGGSYIWANKDYTSLPNVDAFTSQTIAGNNGIALRLGPENTGTIIDAVGWGDFNNLLFEGNPFPENPRPNQTLERKRIAGVYQDTNNNREDFYLNSPPEPSQPETEILSEEEPIEEVRPPQTQEMVYPLGVIINEILPSPDGPDEKEEWIETFNQNDFEVDVSGWQITDIEGKTTTYTFHEGPKISARGFLVLSRPTTKITLNNDGDGLNLIQPDGKIIDSVNYEKASRGQSYNRTDSGWVWSKTLTPGAENIVPGPISEKKESESLKEAQEITPEKGLAGIGEQIPKSLSIFLLALTIAIFSGIIILILKIKLRESKTR